MVEFVSLKISTRVELERERANLKEKGRDFGRVSAERESYVFGEEERRRRREEKRGEGNE